MDIHTRGAVTSLTIPRSKGPGIWQVHRSFGRMMLESFYRQGTISLANSKIIPTQSNNATLRRHSAVNGPLFRYLKQHSVSVADPELSKPGHVVIVSRLTYTLHELNTTTIDRRFRSFSHSYTKTRQNHLTFSSRSTAVLFSDQLDETTYPEQHKTYPFTAGVNTNTNRQYDELHPPAHPPLLHLQLGPSVDSPPHSIGNSRRLRHESCFRPKASIPLPPTTPSPPPSSVFAPVWTLLYGMMGYASYRAYQIGTSPSSLLTSSSPTDLVSTTYHTSTLYTIQLGLNLIWMPLFFGIRRPIEATLDCAALVGINAYLAYVWGTKIDATAGWLMVPYVAWLSFATYLSAGSGYLNQWDFSEERIRRGEERRKAEGKDL